MNQAKKQKKQNKQNDEETKSAAKAQANLSSFFGQKYSPTIGSKVTKRGKEALLDDFPQGKVDIWNWNVNGVNAVINKGNLQKFIKENDPTVLCLEETKHTTENLDTKRFFDSIGDEYAQYWNECTIKKGYSGTAIFTKVKPLKVEFNFGQKHTDEGRSITMEFKKFILVAAYVPNAGEGLKRLGYRVNEWDADFQDYLKELEVQSGKPVVLTGDLNVAHKEMDVYDPKGKEKVPGFTP